MILKRKIVRSILSLLIFSTFASPTAIGMQGKRLNINAGSFIAMDSETGVVLAEKNSEQIRAMASTTKILTCLIAIEYCDLNDEVVVSKKAATTYGSKVHLRTGEKIKMEELLYGLMMKSGNDAAVAIAEHIAGDVEGFSEIMNDYAMKLGVLNSNFKSPHGLDKENHYSSSYDLAKVTAAAMKHEKFRDIAKCKSIDGKARGFNRSYVNINKILHRLPNSNGVKTGYTGNAGKCLVSSFDFHGRNIIIVTLNCPNRWQETIKIANFVKENFELTEIYKKGQIIGEVKVENSIDKVNVVVKEEVVIPLMKGCEFERAVKVAKDIIAPISAGTYVGSIEVKRDGIKLYETPLVSSAKIDKSGKITLFIYRKILNKE